MSLVAIGGKWPLVCSSAYIDPAAVIMGEVRVGEEVGVWPGAVIRGDDAPVILERHSMVLENCVIEAPQGCPVVIGRGAIISHGAIIHGATVEQGALVGIGAIVLEGAVVGGGAIVGAAGLVTAKSQVRPKTLALGIPAREVRELSAEDEERLKQEGEALREKVARYKRARSEI